MTAKKKSDNNISKQRQLDILKILSKTYHGMGSALEFSSPFQLLIATALAAQTTDVQVNKVTRRLFADYPDVWSMEGITPEKLIPYIKSLGLYRNKAKHIAAMVQMLISEFQGIVPKNREDLMKLPGVGRKTANVVLANAFNIPAMAVDTHVFRVSNRLGLAQSDTVLGVEEQLCALIPEEEWSQAHHWLIWHGRHCCKAQKPQCQTCPVGSLCISMLEE